MAECEYSVCETCQQKLTTVPSEHKCLLREGAHSCPLTKIGCPAGTFVSVHGVHACRDTQYLEVKEVESSGLLWGNQGNTTVDWAFLIEMSCLAISWFAACWEDHSQGRGKSPKW